MPSLTKAGISAAQQAESTRQHSRHEYLLDIIPVNPEGGGRRYYFWVALRSDVLYVGLTNGVTVTDSMWAALFRYLDLHGLLADPHCVELILVNTQRNLNPISGIMSLAYATLVAQGMLPCDVHRVLLHEGRLNAWFRSCYLRCDDSGDSSCLLPLSSANGDFFLADTRSVDNGRLARTGDYRYRIRREESHGFVRFNAERLDRSLPIVL